MINFLAIAATSAEAPAAPLAWHPLYWHWWILGLALMSVEAFLPGAFFLWLGLAALIVGGALAVLPQMDIDSQVLIYAVLVFISAALWWRLRQRGEVHESAKTPLNNRGAWYRNRVFTLNEPIINGVGELRVDDGQWRVSGPDLPAGSQVTVQSVTGTTLHVIAAPATGLAQS